MDTPDPILDEIKQAQLRVEHLERELKDARNARARLIRDALTQQRAIQADVVRATGLTREAVRLITDPTKRRSRGHA